MQMPLLQQTFFMIENVSEQNKLSNGKMFNRAIIVFGI